MYSRIWCTRRIEYKKKRNSRKIIKTKYIFILRVYPLSAFYPRIISTIQYILTARIYNRISFCSPSRRNTFLRISISFVIFSLREYINLRKQNHFSSLVIFTKRKIMAMRASYSIYPVNELGRTRCFYIWVKFRYKRNLNKIQYAKCTALTTRRR